MAPVGLAHARKGVNHLLSLFGLIAVQTKEFFFQNPSLLPPPPTPNADFSRVALLSQLGEMGGRGTNGLVSRGTRRGKSDKFSRAKKSGGGSRLRLPASERRCLSGPVPVVIQYVRARRGLISDCVLLTAVPPHRQHAVSEWRFVSGADQR